MNDLTPQTRADILSLAVKFAADSDDHFETKDIIATAQAFAAFVANETQH